MRILEIILLVICIISIITISIKKDSFFKNIKLTLIFTSLIIHLIFEGYRWQLIPIYILVGLISFCIYKEHRLFKGNWVKKSLKIIGITTLLLLGILLSNGFPFFDLPKPTGNYKVGSKYIHLKTNREETITSNTDDKRELMIKVWYPANIKKENKEPYLNDGDRISFANKYGMPNSIFNYLDYIKTNTYLEPKIANEKFPILIFSHGSYSKASGYYAIIEEIVSHGYIVLNINHTYESTGTLFPDGSLKLYNQEYDKKYISTKEMGELAWNSSQNYNNSKNEKERLAVSENILKNYIAADISKRWSKDIISVIDKLQDWNKNSFLANHLDISRIGVFGHSQGGSSIGQALLDDNRIKAGVNLDGVQWGEMIDKKLTKPFLLISSEWISPHPNFNKYAYKNGSTDVFYNAKIKNSGHSSFMDIPLMINIPPLNEGGTINKKEAYKIINKTVILFFDNHLKNKENDLLKLKEEFSSLEISIK